MHSELTSFETIFHCTQCGECCRGYGGTFVTREDINNIANYLNVSSEKILADYCQQSGGKPVLGVAQNGYCVFWDRICSIHPVKPHMCRAWPYIESVLKDISNWRAMASCCPGMRADASEQNIRETVQNHLENKDNSQSP